MREQEVTRTFLPCRSLKEASRLDVEASRTSWLPGSWAVESTLPAGGVGRGRAGPVFPVEMTWEGGRRKGAEGEEG